LSGRTEIELLFLLVVNCGVWQPWWLDLDRPSRLFSPLRMRIALLGNVVLCLAAILFVLVTAAAPEVRGSAYDICAYELMSALWLAVALRLFPLFGVSLREDVVERRNRGALHAVNGALAGIALCFAASNMGEGPGPGAVLFCAALTSAAFFLLWFAADLAGSHWADAITIDRDRGAGLRLGCLLLSIGAALGSAVTGDWVSEEDTLRDFVLRSWPALPVLAVALLAERRMRRASRSGWQSWLAPAAYAGIALVSIAAERHMR
jgi:hypothetical protein